MTAEKIGMFLKKKRKEKNLTLNELAKLMGYSNPYLSQIERGKKGVPSPELLQKYANHLKNVSYMELMRIAGYMGETHKANNDYRHQLNELLDHAFKDIVRNDNFIDACMDDINALESKYGEILEIDQTFTPQLIRNFANEPTWQQEWIFDLARDLLVLSRKYDSQKEELLNFLDQPLITYNYQTLTNDDKQRIKDMLNILFPDKKTRD